MIDLPYGYTKDDSLAIVKLLVKKDADQLTKHTKGVSHLMKVADAITVLRDGEIQSLLNLAVLDFLLERNEYGRLEKMEAMEFAGATILK